MSFLTSANNLDLDGWLRGLVSAGISGGASALTGGLVVGATDPTHYNFSTSKFWTLTGFLFLANAMVSMAKFLQTQPIPGFKQIEITTVQTTKGNPAIVETVKETHVEPIETK